MKDNNNKKKASPWKSIQLGLAILAGLLVYAYGFQVTRVDLEDLRSERATKPDARDARACQARNFCIRPGTGNNQLPDLRALPGKWSPVIAETRPERAIHGHHPRLCQCR